MIKTFIHSYNDIISLENLLLAWKNFRSEKSNKKDVQIWQRNLMENLLKLHNDLKTKNYKHSGYYAFKISDPKPRDIHKAIVCDRILHHALYQKMYFFFDSKFISDSYSCRKWKGTHKGMNKFRDYFRKVSKNNSKTCWVLKCDIKKFFASIDHNILKSILVKFIKDKDIIWLLDNIIDSFYTSDTNSAMAEFVSLSKGLPLGNLTSQLLVNIYMNEFDQFVKHKLKVKYYIRYADDFVILSQDKNYLENILEQMKEFLENELKLTMHPDKVFIKTIYSGVDFLGWVHFPKHRVLRNSTKKRMFRNLKNNQKPNTIASYLGMLGHGNGYKLSMFIEAERNL
ncbi:MAG: reverse transcriptase/maturase family protein [Candidatus Paceibacterota bacterium]|jgi:retron-type reverse transcriptase